MMQVIPGQIVNRDNCCSRTSSLLKYHPVEIKLFATDPSRLRIETTTCSFRVLQRSDERTRQLEVDFVITSLHEYFRIVQYRGLTPQVTGHIEVSDQQHRRGDLTSEAHVTVQCTVESSQHSSHSSFNLAITLLKLHSLSQPLAEF